MEITQQDWDFGTAIPETTFVSGSMSITSIEPTEPPPFTVTVNGTKIEFGNDGVISADGSLKVHRIHIGDETLDAKQLQDLINMKAQFAKLKAEFDAIKDHLAQRSTSLAELEAVVTLHKSP